MTTQSPKQIVVLGGGYAGMMMALRLAGKLRRAGKSHTAQITLISATDHFVERIRLHQLAAGQSLKTYPYTKFFNNTDIRFVQGWVEKISPSENNLTVKTANGVQTLRYDTLAYALGSTIDTSRVPGASEYAYTLGSEKIAQTLHEKLAMQKGRVVIVGGGLTGIEAASEIAEAYPHLKVSLVTRAEVGESVSAQGREHLRRVLKNLGVDVIENRTITQITREHVEVEGQAAIPFEICVWAGAFGVPQLAAQASIRTNAMGQIIVDGSLRSVSHPNIYAIGDSASLENVLSYPVRMSCAAAMPMGAYAGSHLFAALTGENQPDSYSFGYAGQCISLGRKNGLVQLVNLDDSPKNQMLTGWLAVRVKEAICRFTVGAIYAEKRLPGIYMWPKNKQVQTVAQLAHS